MSGAVGLGFRAQRGGSVVVGVVAEGGSPKIVHASFLATAGEGDGLALAPYAVAIEMMRGRRDVPAEVIAAVAEGRRRQEALAIAGVDGILAVLRGEGYGPILGGLIVNRAGWVTDLLAYGLSAPEHAAVAEGLAVRDALRRAFVHCGIDALELDEKSLAQDPRLAHLPRDVARPWRKEQKLAALAAWVRIAEL